MSSGLYSGASGIALGVGLYRQVAGLWSGASGLVSGFDNPIPPLFAGGAQGAWFDFTDTSTWYQDAAGTTPAATLGDVVGLVLDKSRGLALGPELVTNGDFASGTTGWTVTGGVGSQAVVSGELVLTPVISTPMYSTQSFTTVVGKWYRVTGSIVSVSGPPSFYGIRKADDASATVNVVSLKTVVGSADAVFLATATTTYIVLQVNGIASAATATFDNISVKLLAGNHASQATTAQKPLRARIPFGGRRNVLTYTEDFSNAAWNKGTGGSISGSPVTDPDGTTTAAAYTWASSTATYAYLSQHAPGTSQVANTYSIWLKRPAGTGERTLRLAITDYTLSTGNGSTVTVTESWQQFSYTRTSTFTTGFVGAGFLLGASGVSIAAGDVLHVWHPQLELGSSATAYQKVVADWDVTESGVTSIPALYYDGSDDSLATAAIDFATCTSDGAARRNLLTFPSAFNDSSWTKNLATVTENAATAPDGTTTADLLYPNSTGVNRYVGQQYVTTAASVYTSTVYAKMAGIRWIAFLTADGSAVAAWFDLQTGTVGTVLGGYTASISPASNGYYRCAIVSTAGAVTSFTSYIVLCDANGSYTVTANGTDGVYIWGAQSELGSTATAFQDIGTDAVTVFAGVEKLSDAAQRCVVEFGSAAPVGSFSIWAPPFVGAYYAFWSKGTALASNAYAGGYPAPNTSILTGIGDISADQSILRANGAQVASDATDQGTGNYGNYPLYLGRRAGTTFPFKGYMIGHMVIVGILANASEIAAVEATERAATGAY